MIRSLEADIGPTGEILGTVYLEGHRFGTHIRFLKTPDARNAMSTHIEGRSGLETLINFHLAPPEEGIRRLHELIQDEGAIPPVLERWGKQIYPAIAGRLASPQRPA
jgi:hypothetical protein